MIRACRPADVPRLHELILALADYERMRDAVTATPADLEAGLFGVDAVAHALIAESESEILGYAIYFPTFSSFKGRPGIWLEDIFVLPPHRGRGVGRALLQAVARHALERGCARLEWEALDWNAPALGFYERLGARTRPEWVAHRLEAEALARFAGSSPPSSP